MNKIDPNKILKIFKSWYFLVRNDTETLIQVRTLALAVIACLVIHYSIHSLIITPKHNALLEKQAHHEQINLNNSKKVRPDLAPEIKRLNTKKLALQRDLAILNIKNEFLIEQWSILSNRERFNNIIFTTSALAPVHMNEDLNTMTLGESRSVEAFEIHPATLAGKGYFQDFLAYLQYLEYRPETGGIENLVLENLPGDNSEKPAKIKFTVIVNRIQLNNQT